MSLEQFNMKEPARVGGNGQLPLYRKQTLFQRQPIEKPLTGGLDYECWWKNSITSEMPIPNSMAADS